MLDRGKIRTFVLGGVAGALAGILLAPRSGRELRGSLASRAGEARERGRETYFDAQERARERLSETLDRTPPTKPPAAGESETPEGASPGAAPVLEPLPRLGGPGEGEGFEEPLAEEPLAGSPPEEPPPLRDVSRDASPGAAGEALSGPPHGGSADDPEELRRRIRETRARLRRRLDGPEGPSGGGDA